MLLVYIHKNMPRFAYISEYVLETLCGFKISITTNAEEFKSYSGPKLSYRETPLQDELSIIPHSLLFERGIKQQNISLSSWKSTPVLFKNAGREIPFDLFAASFFLLSRYEEYLPHISDTYNRFEADSSIAFQNNFLHLPVINLWAQSLKELLLQKFRGLESKETSYRYISTIDIDNAWAYKHKGFMRTVGAFARDVVHGDLAGIKERIEVFAGRKQDPYDTYEHLLSVQRIYSLEMIFFFLLGNYGVNDKNISANNLEFQALIKHLGDYAETGIHPSFGSNNDVNRVRVEISRLAQITHRNIVKSRQHFLKLHLPQTYKNLITCGIREDYTMGYASQIGFRAGTCTPFNWYDLDVEKSTQLLVYPFCVMDATLHFYMKLNPQEAIVKCGELIEQIKKVKGTCITLWHNETISNWRLWKGWHEVYREVVKLAVN
jgi:hypothetical protein